MPFAASSQRTICDLTFVPSLSRLQEPGYGFPKGVRNPSFWNFRLLFLSLLSNYYFIKTFFLLTITPARKSSLGLLDNRNIAEYVVLLVKVEEQLLCTPSFDLLPLPSNTSPHHPHSVPASTSETDCLAALKFGGRGNPLNPKIISCDSAPVL